MWPSTCFSLCGCLCGTEFKSITHSFMTTRWSLLAPHAVKKPKKLRKTFWTADPEFYDSFNKCGQTEVSLAYVRSCERGNTDGLYLTVWLKSIYIYCLSHVLTFPACCRCSSCSLTRLPPSCFLVCLCVHVYVSLWGPETGILLYFWGSTPGFLGDPVFSVWSCSVCFLLMTL